MLGELSWLVGPHRWTVVSTIAQHLPLGGNHLTVTPSANCISKQMDYESNGERVFEIYKRKGFYTRKNILILYILLIMFKPI